MNHNINCVFYMLEFYPTKVSDINIGAFPLNHDCILKVRYISHIQYFTCRSQDSGQLALIISALNIVKNVQCIEVNKF